MRDIVDEADFCRKCRGEGGVSVPTERNTTIFEPCALCRGSGLRTVRVDKTER